MRRLTSTRRRSLRPDTLFSTRGMRLAASFAARTDLKAVLADPQCQRCVEDQQLAWRQIIAQGVLIGVPLPSECQTLLNLIRSGRSRSLNPSWHLANWQLVQNNVAAICGSLHYYDTIRSVQMAPATMLASQLEQLGYKKC